MSKILRRPMFRGGPVNSEGTGITSGLDEGYATGGRVGYQRAGFVGDSGDYTYDLFGKEFEKGVDLYSLSENQQPNIYTDLLEPGTIEKRQQEAIEKLAEQKKDYGKFLSSPPGGIYPIGEKAIRPDSTKKFLVDQARIRSDYAESQEGQKKIRENLLAQQKKQAQIILDNPKLAPDKVAAAKQILSITNKNTDTYTDTGKDQNEISMDDVEARTEKYAKLLGYDKAKTQSIYDAMLAASPAFFKGRSFGETASGVLEAVNKSGAFDKPTNIKQAAAQLAIQREILMDKAKAEAAAKMAELGYKKPGTLGERYTAYVKGGTEREMAKEFSVRETYGDAYKPYQYNPDTAKPGEVYRIPLDPKNPKGPQQYVIILDPNKKGLGYEFKPIL
jgi:hypothetical protein